MLVPIVQVTPFLSIYPKNININVRTMETLGGELSAEKILIADSLFLGTENNLLGQQEGLIRDRLNDPPSGT